MAKYTLLTAMCINQVLMWTLFGLPLLAIFYLIPLATFGKRMLEETLALVFELAGWLGWV